MQDETSGMAVGMGRAFFKFFNFSNFCPLVSMVIINETINKRYLKEIRISVKVCHEVRRNLP